MIKERNAAIVVIPAGTKVDPIIKQLLKIPKSLRVKVKEITLDMANSMKVILKNVFLKPNKQQTVSTYKN